MIRTTQHAPVLRRTVVVALLLVGMAACSGDDAAPESDRRCAVVSSGELSDILDADLELQELEDPEQESTLCTYADPDPGAGNEVGVDLTVDAPVEAGLPELLLTDPSAVDDLGDEAWIATRNIPGDIRLITRVGGAMLTVDLTVVGATRSTLEERVVEIAEAGLDALPDAEVAEPEGPRGEEACTRYTTDEVAAIVGGVATATPTTPPGSCALAVDSIGLTVNVSVLVESGATTAELGAMTSAVDTGELAEVEGKEAVWLPSAPGLGGQLTILDGDRLLQIAVIGDLETDEARTIAEGLVPVATT